LYGVLDYVVVVVVVKIDLSLHGLLLPLESRLLKGGLGTWFVVRLKEGTKRGEKRRGRDEAVLLQGGHYCLLYL
jgi:hypothetical protein